MRLLLYLAVAILIWTGWRRWWIHREADKLTQVFEEVPNAIPYFPREKNYARLSNEQERRLETISPSVSSRIGARPCKVTLDDGTEHTCVYIAPAQDYIDALLQWPEDLSTDDPDVAPIEIERVAGIDESPYRVPPEIAKQILEYDMEDRGGMKFVAEFSNGERWRYSVHDYAEFLAAPAGLTFADVVAIGEWGADALKLPSGRALKFRWCLHGHGKPPENVQVYRR